jgi:GNAT superfamily N-acetyltransferase
MEKIPRKELSIELLNAKFNLTPFDSGDVPDDDELDDFLKNDALKEQRLLLSRTHLCFYRDRIAGFISLAADSVRLDKLDKCQHVDGIEYPAYPCILIARLAVDKQLHKRGVGRFLLQLAIGFALEGPLGCRYLSVDPKNTSIDFYKKFGFNYWTTNKRRMYLNMEDVARKSQREESLDFWSIEEEGPKE